MERYDNDSNVKLLSLEYGAKGLGIRLSKSSWDPYPFVSHVDDKSIAQECGLQAGDCILKVTHKNRQQMSITYNNKNISQKNSEVNFT